jgi:hypothetical protein
MTICEGRVPAGGRSVAGPRPLRMARLAPVLSGWLLLLGWPAAAAGQLAVDAAELFVHPRDSGAGIATFTVTNNGQRVEEAIIYLADWERTEAGEHRFHEPGALTGSCQDRLDIFPRSVRLPPGGAQEIRIAVGAGEPADRACWNMIFVEGGPSQAGENGLRYVTRYGIQVYGLPAFADLRGELLEFDVRSAGGADRAIALGFRNSGGVPLQLRGRVEFRRLDNTVAQVVALPGLPVLPGAVRRTAIAVPVLEPGRYVVLGVLDYGGRDMVAAQIELDVDR